MQPQAASEMAAAIGRPSGRSPSPSATVDTPPCAPRPSPRPHSALVATFDRFASQVTRWAGSPVAFAIAFLSIAVWASVGRLFDFSENWQLVINTGTTIVTFLMVFLIQQSQNKDSVALHLKINELLAANQRASNRMIGIEGLDEQDLRDIATFYNQLAERVGTRQDDRTAHSIDDGDSPGEPAPGQA